MAYELHHTRRGPPRHRPESRDDRTNSPTPPPDTIAATSAAAHTRWDQAPRRRAGGRSKVPHLTGPHRARLPRTDSLEKQPTTRYYSEHMVLGARNRGEGIRTRLLGLRALDALPRVALLIIFRVAARRALALAQFI